MARASVSDFLPDDALKFRGPDAGALEAGVFTSSSILLAKLTPYWVTNEYGIAQNLPIIVGFIDVDLAAQQVITFEVEVDSATTFGSPTVVSRIELTGAQVLAEGGRFVIPVDVRNLAKFDATATHLRLKATFADGQDQAFIDIPDWLVEGDEFTLDDGTTGAESVKVGTMEAGSIVIAGGAMSAGDKVIIDDGVNDPVAFEFGVGDGLILVGANAAASATNLGAAIEAAVAAGDLQVAVADQGTGTLNIVNLAAFTGGAITEDTDDNARMTVTDFTGGVDGAVRTAEMITAAGGDRDDQLDDIVAAIDALASGSFSATRDGNVVRVVNSAPDLGVSEGEAVIETDAGSVMTLTDFAVAAVSVNFWAYVKNSARNL